MDDGRVCLRWKDYRDDNRQKTMTLPAEEFIRRFLIHVLPGGFHRIRYFGFLGNCHRARKLALCRQLLGMAPAGPIADPPSDYRDRFAALTGQSLRECPHCHAGIMVVIDCIAATQNLPSGSRYIMKRDRRSNRMKSNYPPDRDGDTWATTATDARAPGPKRQIRVVMTVRRLDGLGLLLEPLSPLRARSLRMLPWSIGKASGRIQRP